MAFTLSLRSKKGKLPLPRGLRGRAEPWVSSGSDKELRSWFRRFLLFLDNYTGASSITENTLRDDIYNIRIKRHKYCRAFFQEESTMRRLLPCSCILPCDMLYCKIVIDAYLESHSRIQEKKTKICMNVQSIIKYSIYKVLEFGYLRFCGLDNVLVLDHRQIRQMKCTQLATCRRFRDCIFFIALLKKLSISNTEVCQKEHRMIVLRLWGCEAPTEVEPQ